MKLLGLNLKIKLLKKGNRNEDHKNLNNCNPYSV